ncbi:unnamed protein product [Phytomonas sp. EM1]|nr:unnamed protein product [Phytomonas sp. EM1]|eukprot:CCW62015.1 unnamed protein product [Phytomonas sp. isolate EM1]
MSDAVQQIDHKFLDRQSRTIGTYGLETMAKLISFKVLIVGCGAVGIEIAKNLSLAGVHTIHLYDPRKATLADMGVNFAVGEHTIKANKTLAEASCAYITELNPNTRVRVATELSEAVVGQNIALIITSDAPDLSTETLIHWDRFCRSHKPVISFILALQTAAVGSVFVDHGPSFVVNDVDGRSMLQKSIMEIVTLIDKAGDRYSRIRFETPEGQTPGALRDYTQIKLTDVVGLTKPNGESANNRVFDGVVCLTDPRNTVRVYPSFDDQGYGAYETGGFFHEVKETIPLAFRSLQECLPAPGDFVQVSPMMDNAEESQTHLFINALLRFADTHKGRLPALHSQADAEDVVVLARTIIKENRAMPRPSVKESPVPTAPKKAEFPFKKPPPQPPVPLVVEEINEDSIHRQSVIAAVELQPLASFIGAVVAQEVVKITGKYTPIHQWFHLSMEAVLPDSPNYGGPEFSAPNSRYRNLIAIFGKSFHEKLSNLKIFQVGCGALGCENLKNFALSGIACGERGSLIVTDNDRIEVSNLSRQFLFREENVGQSKSAAAGARTRQINSHAKVDARQDFIGTTTEHLYPDTFWQQLDVVVSALDNMEARLYVDQQCVRFHKVLVESGTMGTGGNVDIIVPGKTTSYADGGTADQTGGIPMCTLRNFPYIYDHCIEWARAQFDDLFVSPMNAASQIVEEPGAFTARIKEEIEAAKSDGERLSLVEKHLSPLRSLKQTLEILAQGPSMSTCIQMALSTMFKLFRDRIYDLQTCFPKDSKKKNGEPFWSGHRRYPQALEVDPHNILSSPDVLNFIISAANLYACMFGLHPLKHEARYNDEQNRWMKQYRTKDWLQSELSGKKLPEYVAREVEDLDEDVAAEATPIGEVSLPLQEAKLRALLDEVVALARGCSHSKAAPLEFEKDDDDNFQIDFIAAASNLRAANYHIPPQDRMKVKMVAGKIIPAVMTTTAAVTGLVLIELFKVLQNKDVSTLRNGMLDVGTNNYVLFERNAPVRHRTRIVSTYLPEQDMTYKKKVICIPDGFTKYDSIKIDVSPSTTVHEFVEKLLESLNSTLPTDAGFEYEIDGLGVGKGLLWNGLPTHPNTHASLMCLIEKQKATEMVGATFSHNFWEGRTQFFDLTVMVSVDDGDATVDEEEVETAPICLCIKP